MSKAAQSTYRSVRLWHGGDYNPDQWPAAVRAEDARLMKLTHVNIASTGIFAWSQLEPAPGVFDWSWLDETFERLHKAAVWIALATPSAAHPRWLTAKYPQVMAVDDRGIRLQHGVRQRFCPTSPVFREHVERVNRALAERYGKHPALALWHVSNEYGAPRCWCNLCATAFREWLEARYGTLEALNHQWWGTFWSQRYSDWAQIRPPSTLTGRAWPGLELDWKRFQSHLLCEFFKLEAATLREITPHVPITTNLMGTYGGLDYAKFADVLDVVSWDSYPAVGGDPSAVACTHAYMRGIKHNQPWLLMEQTPSATNWQEFATLKPPGLMALWSWQAIGHGSDAAMYFQWRRSRGGPEKLHGAVVEHAASEKARVFQEVAALGADLEKATPAVAGTRVAEARVGILYDQECRWAFEGSGGPGHAKPYVGTVMRHYKALWRRNVPVDLVRMDGDWSQYKLLIAPLLYMVKSGEFPLAGSPEQMRTKLNEGAKIEEWVRSRGTFVTTYLSGIVNENDLVYEGGYPGPLRKLLGIWVDEIDNVKPGEDPNRIVIEKNGLKGLRKSYACDHYYDQIVPEGAEVLARYGKNWYAGKPCLTRNAHGQGVAYYLGCDAEDSFLLHFYAALTTALGLQPTAEDAADVEALERHGGGRSVLFLLNHASAKRTVKLGGRSGRDVLSGAQVSGRVALGPYGVRVIEMKT
ncbi:MAG: beta-galactosidase [Planctomycetota bacterium]|nr:beta-galactosidase [Planctomycetota bacterium]